MAMEIVIMVLLQVSNCGLVGKSSPWKFVYVPTKWHDIIFQETGILLLSDIYFQKCRMMRDILLEIYFFSESRAEICGKFWSVVLEKDGYDQLDPSCEKWSITKSQGGEE